MAIGANDWQDYLSNSDHAVVALSQAALVIVPEALRQELADHGSVNAARVWSLDALQPPDILSDLDGGRATPADLRLRVCLASRLVVEIGMVEPPGVVRTETASSWDLEDCVVDFNWAGAKPVVSIRVKGASAWGADSPGRQFWRLGRLRSAWGLAAIATSDVALAEYAGLHPAWASCTWLHLPYSARASWDSELWDRFGTTGALVERVVVSSLEEARHLELRFPTLSGTVLFPASGMGCGLGETIQNFASRYGRSNSQLAAGSHRSCLLVTSHDMKFAKPIADALERRGGVDVTSHVWETQHYSRVEDSISATVDRDVVWVDFASGVAGWHAARKGNRRLVVRVHGYEVDGPWGDDIDFACVDTVVFPSEHLRTRAVARWGLSLSKTRVIPNPIDVWNLSRPKSAIAPWTLGLLGWTPHLKRFDRALSLLNELIKVDDRFVLSVKGRPPHSFDWVWGDPGQRAMFDGAFAELRENHRLAAHVFFEDAGPDVSDWLTNIGWILSPSERESFHLAAMEGMASGSVPVVWKREGAGDVFPPDFLIEDVPSAARRILDASERGDFEPLSRLARRSADRFDFPLIVDEWADVLQLGTGPWA
ncbi:glycosyltransferase [Knoellia sp. S7-12]|uniref:glycosyltransferase n=1 Tax=Knoellia sp. S7-12 TaxID=3126698 RepID=UPI0033666116